jgi:hypothetical protein
MSEMFDRFRKRVDPHRELDLPRAPNPAPPPAPVHPGDAREPYAAFGAKDNVNDLVIRLARPGALSQALPYHYLTGYSFDDGSWTLLFLTGNGLGIEIRGRNLKPIVDAIELRKCQFIQEYSAAKFQGPPAPDAPFVESISVEVLQGPATPEAKDAGPNRRAG